MNFDNKAAVQAYLKATLDDLNSSVSSLYHNKMQPFRQTIEQLHELLEGDRMNLKRCSRVLKDLQRAGDSHLLADAQFAENLERIGSSALLTEPRVGTAFLKFSIIVKELSSVTKNKMQAMSNMLLFPLTAMLKNDFRQIDQDLKRNFDKAWREHDSARLRLEKEKRKTAETFGALRADTTPNDYANELQRERRLFQLGMCEYLIKANEVRTKKGVDYMQHLLDYYHSHCRLFEDGLKVLHDLRNWADALTNDLHELRVKQEEEKHELVDLRKQLRNQVAADKENPAVGGYSLHIPSGEESFGMEKTGYLLKRSEGIRRVFQKRYCQVKDGHFIMAHSPTAQPTATLTLLTCNVKEASDTDGKKNCFHLITPAGNRTYVFSADSPADRESWLSVIRNSHKRLLEDKFDQFSQADTQPAVKTMKQLVQGIIDKVKTLPGNDTCCDCGAPAPTWLSYNLGVLTCIECSGIHRDLGVQYARVASITLDKLSTAKLTVARAVGNQAFNDIMEANLTVDKPGPDADMATRKDYIKAKYVDHQFVSSSLDQSTLKDLVNAVASKDIFALLQAFGEGVDLSSVVPNSRTGDTILQYAVTQEDETSLHMVDFIIWNILDRTCVNKKNLNGETALHIAAKRHKVQCIKLLLRGGADVEVVNNDGKTAVDLAKDYECIEAVELLNEAANKKFDRCENIRIDWGLEVDKEDEEKIYDEPPQDDTKCLSPMKQLRERPASVATMVAVGKPPVRSSSLRDYNNASPYAQRRGTNVMGLQPKKHASENDLLKETAVSIEVPTKKRTPAPNVPAPYMPTSSSQMEIKKTHRRMVSEPIARLDSTPHRRLVSGNVSSAPVVMRNLDVSGNMKRNVSYTKALKNEKDSVDSGGGGSKQMAGAHLSSEGVQRTVACGPPPLPTKLREKKTVNGCLSNAETLPTAAAVSRPVQSSQGSQGGEHPDMKQKPPILKKKPKRAKAQFDCSADHADELSFIEGEVVLVVQELDEDWWFGHIEGDEQRAGVFPRIYVDEID